MTKLNDHAPADLFSLDDPEGRAVYEDTLNLLRLRAAGKAARNEERLTQKDVATRMETAQSAVSELEAGRVDAQLTTWQRYARAIGRRITFRLDPTHEGVSLPVAEMTLRPILRDLSLTSTAKPASTISRDAKLPLPLVERVLTRLTDEGWTHTTNVGESPGFTLVDEAANIVGISLHRDRIIGTLTDMRGEPQTSVTTRMVTHPIPDTIVDEVVSLTDELFRISQSQEKRVLGIGVCLAGVVDAANGIVFSAPDLQTPDEGWNGVDLESRLQARIKAEVHSALRVVVLNDANALAVAHYQGRKPITAEPSPTSAAVVVMSGGGIGAGILINGELYPGSHSTAGEIGHFIVDRHKHARACRAGLPHKGCLETVATSQGILRALDLPADTAVDRERGLSGLNDLIAGGDKKARDSVRRAGQRFGSALPQLALLDSPDIAIFCVPILHDLESRLGQAFREGVTDAVSKAKEQGLVPSGDLQLKWHDLTESTLATSAGIAMLLLYFMDDPAGWYPRLNDVVERDTELVLA